MARKGKVVALDQHRALRSEIRRGLRQQNVYMTPELQKALHVQAAHEGRSLSDLVRDAVTAYLKTHPVS